MQNVTAKFLEFALLIAAVVWLFRQVRNPSGSLGRSVARAMNVGHAKMTDWALGQLTIPKNATLLDIGCGGGRTIQCLAALAPDGEVVGLDNSATSVATSRETNAKEIQAGRVRIEQGSVAAMPFPDGTFDIVTAVETHYYWPDLPANVREIFRVLKPGGTFLLVAETYKGGPLRFLYGIVMPLLGAAYSTKVGPLSGFPVYRDLARLQKRSHPLISVTLPDGRHEFGGMKVNRRLVTQEQVNYIR